MAHTRINASIRDTVIANAIKGPLAELELKGLELVARKTELQTELDNLGYETCYTKAERDRLAAIPSGWVPRSLNGMVQINGAVKPISFGSDRPVPFDASTFTHGSRRILQVLEDGCAYLEKQKEFKAADEALDQHNREFQERRRYLKAKVTAIVESVTTVNRLIEIWPQVVDFLPEQISDPITGVPAIMIEDLNRELGITPKTQE